MVGASIARTAFSELRFERGKPEVMHLSVVGSPNSKIDCSCNQSIELTTQGAVNDEGS